MPQQLPPDLVCPGSLCVMFEARCALSSYATGLSPNNAGVCSPPSAVRWQDKADGVEARLDSLLIDRYGKDEPRGYPTLERVLVMEGDTEMGLVLKNTLDAIGSLWR